jgi:hypothetical protein
MRWAVAALLGLALACAGCGKKSPPPSCTEIADKMLGFVKGELGGEIGDRKGLIQQCDRTFSDDMKRCLGEAADLNAVAVCRGGKAGQRRPGPTPDKAPQPDPHEGMKK